MKFHATFFLLICLVSTVHAQQDVSLALQKLPVIAEQQRAAAWNALPKGAVVSFVSSGKRYTEERVPTHAQQNEWNIKAWKNEKVHAQILIYSKESIKNAAVVVSMLKSKQGNIIGSQHITTGFIQYVMTDEFRDGCGYRKPEDFDSSKVADLIVTGKRTVDINSQEVQPVWLSITVPADAAPGQYTGNVLVKADKTHTLKVNLTVVDKKLSDPNDWSFRLDLWQHPAAVARVHNLPLWSEAHYQKMKAYYTMLAKAGQKIITASIVDEPWNHQTYDDYPSLVKWTKKKNGTWAYDYSLFDEYISFVMSCGIKERINCYSMVPWKIAFKYYDEQLQRDTVFTEAVGTPAYNEFWGTMLRDFTAHLKKKGWFGITTIAMDERPMEAMQSVIALVKSIDKDWKISLAGEYHEEIQADIYDYCIASSWVFPETVLTERKQQNKASTWYTCCTEKYPNSFSFSPPDESAWLGWYTAATGMDGYLRWAYNSWTKDPLHDTRFTAWPAGDTYQVYPGPYTSMRFEKMIEGIQDFEKINILKKQYAASNDTKQLEELNAILRTFTIDQLATQTAEDMIAQGKALLNR